jgi:hypothetical protein
VLRRSVLSCAEERFGARVEAVKTQEDKLHDKSHHFLQLHARLEQTKDALAIKTSDLGALEAQLLAAYELT